MSTEVANFLLDQVDGLEGEGIARLRGAVDSVEALDPDDRATVEVARLLAGNKLHDVSPLRAGLIVEAVALDLNVTVKADTTAARLAADLDGTLDELVADLEHRLSNLPTKVKTVLRRGIAEYALHRRTRVENLPIGVVGSFARKLATLEEEFAPTPAAPHGATAPAPSRASTGQDDSPTGERPQGAPSDDVGPGHLPDEGEEPAEEGTGVDEIGDGPTGAEPASTGTAPDTPEAAA